MSAQDKQAEPRPDVVLSDGRAITFDKRRITRAEWARLFEPDQPQAEADAIVARFTDTTAEYIAGLNLHDWQLLTRTMYDVVRRPVDPNSPSESILPSLTKSLSS